MNELTIGKIAKNTGLGIETIRYYEKEGLIAPARTESNYRIYPDQDIVRLRFIKRAKGLGFTLKEIKDLLSIRLDPDGSKEEVKRQTETKMEAIRQKIIDLSRILQALESLNELCDGHGPVGECPILEALETGEGLDSD